MVLKSHQPHIVVLALSGGGVAVQLVRWLGPSLALCPPLESPQGRWKESLESLPSI